MEATMTPDRAQARYRLAAAIHAAVVSTPAAWRRDHAPHAEAQAHALVKRREAELTAALNEAA